MKKIPKPVRLLNRPETPALRAVVETSKAPRERLVERSYQQLVTSQNVDPDRAKRLLGTTEK
jgi:hypothetical protein